MKWFFYLEDFLYFIILAIIIYVFLDKVYDFIKDAINAALFQRLKSLLFFSFLILAVRKFNTNIFTLLNVPAKYIPLIDFFVIKLVYIILLMVFFVNLLRFILEILNMYNISEFLGVERKLLLLSFIIFILYAFLKFIENTLGVPIIQSKIFNLAFTILMFLAFFPILHSILTYIARQISENIPHTLVNLFIFLTETFFMLYFIGRLMYLLMNNNVLTLITNSISSALEVVVNVAWILALYAAYLYFTRK